MNFSQLRWTALALTLPRRDEAVRLLRCYLGSLERMRFVRSASCQEIIRRHIIDLFAIAISPHGRLGESGAGAVVAARLAAALNHIAAHFEDPELTLESVARSQGISVRYRQRLMAPATHGQVRYTHQRLGASTEDRKS